MTEETDVCLWEKFTHDVHVVNLFADFDSFLVQLKVCKLEDLTPQHDTSYFNTVLSTFTSQSPSVTIIISAVHMWWRDG